MGRRVGSLSMALILSLTSTCVMIQSSVSAESPSNNYPMIIEMNIDDGVEINELSSFSVTIEDENAPVIVSWELFDTGGSRTFVNATDDLHSQEIAEDSDENMKEWSFEISIDPESTGDCSCILIVRAQDTMDDAFSKAQSIFISNSGLMLAPTLYAPPMYDQNWARANQSFDGVSSTMNGELPEISYYIMESPEMKCDHGEVDSLELSNHYYPEISWFEGEFTISLDVADYRDGWHDILLVSRDLLTALTSVNCVSMRIDNTPPIVSIHGPVEVTEGFEGIIFDGSETDDEIWGRSGIVYVWSVNEISGAIRTNTHVISGVDEKIITFDTNSSGDFEITLTAIDQAGNSATERRVLTVNNLAPVVRLLIDGEPFFDGDEFYLTRTSTFTIDGSESSDTENDLDTLRYVWRVDNVPVYEGSGREMAWPDVGGNEFLLTLEVIDDNAQSSMITVRVLDEDGGFTFPSQLIILVISAAFLGYAIMKSISRNDSESDIPKWV